MKRVLLLLLLLAGTLTLRAQDRIVRLDNQTIEARVLEITPDQVSYKRYSNPDGPTYVLPTRDIRYILYPNGERDEFNATPTEVIKAADEAPEQAPQAAAESPVQSPSPREENPAPTYYARTYSVGDYYDQEGLRGVVCMVEPGGEHGLILSLEESCLHWSTFEKGNYHLVGASSNADGAENMAALEAYIAREGLQWADFPAFAWCRALGEGWYLPSIDEWLKIAFNFNGGDRSTFNRIPRNRFNNQLKSHGGKRLDRLNYYFSSTEQDEASALAGHMAIEPPYVEPLKKSGIRFLVRAVHRF